MLEYTPYAMALLELGKDREEEKKYMEQLCEIANLFDTLPELRQLFSHPNIENEKKTEIIKSAFENQVDDMVYRFLIVMNEHKMLSHMKEIYQAYVSCYEEKYDIEVVKVMSAIELDEEQIEKLTKVLKEKLNKDIKISVEVDPSLIAGLKVQTKDMVMDNTIVSKIDAMKEAMNR